jgi:hypothetical protein
VLSSSPAALPSLKAFAQNDRILFGTDFPFAPDDVAAYFTNGLDAYEGLTADEHRAISHGNAWILFPPRLSARHNENGSGQKWSDQRGQRNPETAVKTNPAILFVISVVISVMPLRRFRSGNFLTAIVLIHEGHEALGVQCSPWFP